MVLKSDEDDHECNINAKTEINIPEIPNAEVEEEMAEIETRILIQRMTDELLVQDLQGIAGKLTNYELLKLK